MNAAAPPSLADHHQINRPDRLDEDVSSLIEARFEQSETGDEVRRTYKFLQSRLDKFHRRYRIRTGNKAATPEPPNEEQLFTRTVKTRFGLTRQEALHVIGYNTYEEFAERERAKAAPGETRFDLLRHAVGLLTEYYREDRPQEM